jgi:hypothetical protein
MALTVLTVKTMHSLLDSSYGTLCEHAMNFFLFNAPPASTPTDTAATIHV